MLKRYFNALDTGLSGTPTFFDTSTGISFSSTFYQETENIIGAAGATLTIQVTTYTNTNPTGIVKVNGFQVVLNDQFTVVLSGGGLGSFVAYVSGNAGAGGTVVRAIFTIVGMTVGAPGTPINKQISKVF